MRKNCRHEITVFRDRYRLDIQTSTPGLHFQDAWDRRQEMTLDGVTLWVVSKEDLIALKRASGRQVDLEDVRILEGGRP
jgi:predicted nucleotidyltransferase